MTESEIRIKELETSLKAIQYYYRDWNGEDSCSFPDWYPRNKHTNEPLSPREIIENVIK